MQSAASRRAGFSLVELLVVTGLVALLAALLLPALGRARERARKIVCVGNLRQIGQATHLYHDQFGRLPTASFPGYLLWNGTDYLLYGRLLPGHPPALGRSFYCPSATRFKSGSALTGLANLGEPGKVVASAYEARGASQGAPLWLQGPTQALLADLFDPAAAAVNHADGVTALQTDGSARFWALPPTWSFDQSNAWSRLDAAASAAGW